MRPFFAVAITLFCLSAEVLFAQQTLYQDNKKAVLYVGAASPVIDGQVEDWAGLKGSSPLQFVYGGPKADRDPSATFILRSDNKSLYVLVEVVDAEANENELPAPLAWRNDSVELYVGTDASPHNKFSLGDSQIRLVPVSRSEPKLIHASVNDVVIDNDPDVRGAVVYTTQGYRIEASIPLRLLKLKGFQPGQAIRAEFQINDATDGEREALVHWSSKKDNTYYDAGSWGDGVVEALPGGR